MTTASTPLPSEVEAVLSIWVPRVRDLLGDALRGILLSGSVALGGFEPGWSDLDVCVQLASEPSTELAAGIRSLHAELEGRFLGGGTGGWRNSQLLEGPYLATSVAGEAGATGRYLRVDTGACRIEVGDPVPGFERYVLAHHAIVLTGDPVAFAPPTRARLARSQSWLLDLLAEPAASHSAIMLAGLLQETARSLVFWRDGVFLDKTAALLREVERAEASGVVLDVRRAGSAHAAAFRGELEAAYECTAGPAGAVLRTLLSAAGEEPAAPPA